MFGNGKGVQTLEKNVGHTNGKRMRHRPYLVIKGEICVITTQWIKQCTPRDAFQLARSTYRELYRLDGESRKTLYEEGFLVDVDAVQDCIVYNRLAAGINLVRRYWPVTAAKAFQSVERALT
ncbi:hypothetical protein LCGC14_2041160 [marine sediment metagenome]|uniref:Uncharacterized protein n=1 Tax=marine sediment metagenome TaxID=412755 RepID=A0A0F9HNX4_9ZZZZ